MKKFMAIALAAIMAVTCVYTAFAWDNSYVDNGDVMEGWIINSNSGSNPYTGALRNYWTPSRNAANNASSDDTSNYNANSICLIDNSGEEPNGYMKLVAPQWINTTGDEIYSGPSIVQADFKKSTVSGFAGIIVNYGDDFINSTANVNSQHDYFYKEFEAVSSDMDYVMATGVGFTFLSGSNSKIRVFVRTLNGTNFDVISYDVETGVDLTENYHKIGFYCNDSDMIQFIFDGVVLATVEYSNLQQLSGVATSAGNTLDCAYYRTASIKDAYDTEKASTTTALIADKNEVNIALTGNGTTLFMDNLETVDTAAAPATAEPTEEPAESEEPTAEPTAAPATEEPAEESETPAEETEAPAEETEAPAEETEEAADATEAPVEPVETGDAFAVVFMLVAAAAIAMVLLKKKVF